MTILDIREMETKTLAVPRDNQDIRFSKISEMSK